MSRNLKPMREILYRATRVAKVLGEPSKYAIIDLLLRLNPLTVSDIASKVRRAQPTVSYHLAALRSLEIVRYEARSNGVYYWIKYPKELRVIKNALLDFVRRTQRGLDHDT